MKEVKKIPIDKIDSFENHPFICPRNLNALGSDFKLFNEKLYGTIEQN